MEELLFTEVDNRTYPNKQLAYSYFISEYRALNKTFEVRPLTVAHLFYAVGRNYGRILYWAFLRLLYKSGFIDVPEAEAFHWKHHFRWYFWKPRM